MTHHHRMNLTPPVLGRMIAAWRTHRAITRAAREKRLAVARLAETSDHLLFDIGLDPHGRPLTTRGLDSPTAISDRAPVFAEKTSCRTDPCTGRLPSAT